ncbi:hypothetical protein [Paenibacillus polymyxa]|uniref:hypothetical protein n=1 Tax=Paenibacillus polymyxa TaxID=1406 RepID=UPI0018664650|nr:hypothetical protein [Paenibacillus polymyxa]MBE3649189.1 hypothetical protein [Paenibacillus polymyxa]
MDYFQQLANIVKSIDRKHLDEIEAEQRKQDMLKDISLAVRNIEEEAALIPFDLSVVRTPVDGGSVFTFTVYSEKVDITTDEILSKLNEDEDITLKDIIMSTLVEKMKSLVD